MAKLVFVLIGAMISTNFAFPPSFEKSNLALPLIPSDAEILQPSKNYVKRSILDNEITGKTVVNHMQKGLGINKKLMDEVNKFLKDIEVLEAEIDQKIVNVTKEIGLVVAENAKHMKLARDAFRNAKLSLHRTRRILLELAEDTIESTKDLQFFMAAWGPEYGEEEKQAYLLEQLRILENLIERTYTELGNAKFKYEEAESQLHDVNKHLDNFEDDLKKLRDEESAEFETLKSRLNKGIIIGGVATIPTTIGAILADFLGGCLGICSITNLVLSSTVLGGQVGAVVTLQQAQATINELYTTISSANTDVKLVKDNTEKLLDFIDVEMRLISSWKIAANDMEARLNSKEQFEQSSTKQYFDLKLFRDIFQNDLHDLQKAATNFMNRKIHLKGISG